MYPVYSTRYLFSRWEWTGNVKSEEKRSNRRNIRSKDEERNEGEILVLIFFGVNHFCKLTDEIDKQKEKKQMNCEGKKWRKRNKKCHRSARVFSLYGAPQPTLPEAWVSSWRFECDEYTRIYIYIYMHIVYYLYKYINNYKYIDTNIFNEKRTIASRASAFRF